MGPPSAMNSQGANLRMRTPPSLTKSFSGRERGDSLVLGGPSLLIKKNDAEYYALKIFGPHKEIRNSDHPGS